MVRGLFTAYTGMLTEQKRLDVISNNLANASTTGYKKEGVSTQSFDDVLAIKIRDRSVAYTQQSVGAMSLGVKIGEVYTDYTQGGVTTTNNTYDFALEGDGFFMISSADAQENETIRYTRDGSFTLDKDGYLVTSNGDYVLDDSRERIQIVNTSGSTPEIDVSGRICIGEEEIATIGIIDFEDYNYIQKYGDNLYEVVEGAAEKESNANIMQGFLETSNVNSVSEMVDMITITRAYEANQKMITTIDRTLDSAVNSVGRI